MDITITANGVAWYAAIVATGSAVVSGYNVWRDRAKLRVTARPNMEITESFDNYSKENTYIMIEVANIGRRPLRLQMLPWFTVKGRKKPVYVLKGSWRPTEMVAEGESATMLCNQDSLEVDLSRLDRAVVRDATGREWKGRVRKGR